MPLLLQIIEVLNALETFSVLSESKIEGIETISNRFQHMYSTLKKKPYDPLDHRKLDFEADFSEFKRHINEIQVCRFFNPSVPSAVLRQEMMCIFFLTETLTNVYEWLL